MGYIMHLGLQTEKLSSRKLSNNQKLFHTSIMMCPLIEAQRKIKDHNFPFNHLPLDRIDPVWNDLKIKPFYLSIQELSALKNLRCPLPPPPPPGIFV